MEKTSNRKTILKSSISKRETDADYFSMPDIVEDYPVIPGKKDFMHIRVKSFFCNNEKKNQ